MSIALQARMDELEKRVAALEARLGPDFMTDETRALMAEINDGDPLPERPRRGRPRAAA